tara:strand:- start:3243 stop:5630 length:2388 start_codon:yes stop_codon:yes gene_type:complete
MVDNIDKALNLGGKPELEILKKETEVVVDGQRVPAPEGLEIQMDDDGGATLDFDPKEALPEIEFYSNLAEVIDDRDLETLSDELMGDFESDKSSRKDWEDAYVKGLGLLGLKYEERSNPFRGASGATHPLLAESATQFQATAFKELLPSGGPVRTIIMGDESPEKYARAGRVQEFMNFQLMNKMEDYTPEYDQMLFYLPLAGSTFKKVYYDELMDRPVSKFVPAEDLVVNYLATDLDSCERMCHVINMSYNDFRKKQVSGFYKDVDILPQEAEADRVKEKYNELDGQKPSYADKVIKLYEFHTSLDLQDFEDKDDSGEMTGIKIPYIVTIEEGSTKVVGIRRNYEKDDPKKMKKQYFVQYKFLPGLGFYGFGLIHMIGGLSRTATDLLRQLIDAGTLSNLPAGFKSRGIRIRDDADPIQPGEFRDIDAPNGDLRNSLIPLPYKEPSQTLYSLLGFVVQAGQRFASIADMQVGDGNQNAPVGTTIALLERGSKIMSAIHKRCYYSQRKEFKLLYNVFADYLPETYPYSVEGADRTIKAEDFDGSLDVLPVADPNIFSTTQRVTLAQTELQLAQSAPDLHNMKEAYRRMYEALGIKDVDEILRKDSPVAPKDPATEHADLLDGNLLQVYEGQDHDAHIQNHLIFGTNQMILANPPMAMKLQKHILEHISLKAKEQTAFLVSQGQLPEEDMDQAIARLEAQFMGELKQASQQLSGGGQPDPAIQLKQQELQQDAQKDQMDSQRDQARIQLDAERLKQKTAIDQARIQKDYDIADKRAEVQYDKMTTQSLNMKNKNASK